MNSAFLFLFSDPSHFFFVTFLPVVSGAPERKKESKKRSVQPQNSTREYHEKCAVTTKASIIITEDHGQDFWHQHEAEEPLRGLGIHHGGGQWPGDAAAGAKGRLFLTHWCFGYLFTSPWDINDIQLLDLLDCYCKRYFFFQLQDTFYFYFYKIL